MSKVVWGMDDYDADQEDLNAFATVLTGMYHAQIYDYRTEMKKHGICHVFSWEIVGTENDPRKLPMIGRKLSEYMHDYESCQGMFRRQVRALAVATGYWTRETLNSAKEQGLSIPAPVFRQFKGLACVIKVQEEEYLKKTYSRIKGYYPVDSNEARESGVLIDEIVTPLASGDDVVL